MKKPLMFALALLLAGSFALRAQGSGCSTPIAVTPAAPFFEDFEGGTIPECWTQSGPGNWTVGSGDQAGYNTAYAGEYNAVIQHQNRGTSTRLYTPLLDLSSIDSCVLNFWQVRRDWSGGVNWLSIYFRASVTDDWQLVYESTPTWNPMYDAMPHEVSVLMEWGETVVHLPAGGASSQVAFEFGDMCGHGLCLDNIYIGANLKCDISLASSDSSSITIQWDNNSTPDSMYRACCYSADGEVVGCILTSAGSATFTGLAPGTEYAFTVVPLCADSTMVAPVVAHFSTMCATVAIPFFEDFSVDAFMPLCWIKNSIYTHPPRIERGGEYFMDDWGYNMVFYGENDTNLVCLPRMADISSLRLSFWGYAWASGRHLDVGVLEDSVFVPVETVPIPGKSKSIFDEYVVYFDSYTGNGDRIALRAAPGTAIYIDNVSVDYADACYSPVASKVVSVDAVSATIQWTDPRNTNATYRVCYWTDGYAPDTLMVTGVNRAVFSGLKAGTRYAYSIETVCDSGTSPALRGFLRTSCGNLTIPYFEGFEDEQGCWDFPTGGVGIIKYWEAPVFSGGRMLRMNQQLGVSMVIAPDFYGVPVGNLQVKLWICPNTASVNPGYFSVGYVTDRSDTSTFVPLDTWSKSRFSGFEEVTVPMYGAPAGASIAFRQETIGWYVDNVRFDTIPDCVQPLRIEVDSVDVDALKVHVVGVSERYRVWWTDGQMADSADIDSADYVITGLAENTAYNVSAASLCDSVNTSAACDIIVRTGCNVKSIPFVDNFDTYPSGDQPWCYRIISGNALVAAERFGNQRNNRLCPYGQDDNYIVLPDFDQPTGNLQVKMALLGSAYALTDTFKVGYMTNISDTSTFVPLESWGASDFVRYGSARFLDVVVPMYYAPDDANIVFKSTSDDAVWWIDSVVVEPISSCLPPTHLRWTERGGDYVTVEFWGGQSGNYRVYIAGDAYSDSADIVGDNSYTFSGLPNTASYTYYTVSVVSDCGNELSVPVSINVITYGVGIDAVETTTFSLYPNPASGSVTVRWPDASGRWTVEIVDLNGRKIAEHTSTNIERTIDVSRLAPGAYFVRAISAGQAAVRKLMVR